MKKGETEWGKRQRREKEKGTAELFVFLLTIRYSRLFPIHYSFLSSQFCYLSHTNHIPSLFPRLFQSGDASRGRAI